MNVECRPFKPTSVGGKVVTSSQYRIFVDGAAVGFIGLHDGACPMIIERKTPSEMAEIQRQIAEQLKPQTIGSVRTAKVDPVQPIQPGVIDYDDFD